MILLDTDVMIDVLRGYDPALAWLKSLGAEPVGLPGLVAMELLQGCRDSQEQRRVQKIMRPYALHWPTPADCTRAYNNFAAFRLGHNIGLLDTLIAETAVGLAAPLVTFNDKHYRVIGGLQLLEPYSRFP